MFVILNLALLLSFLMTSFVYHGVNDFEISVDDFKYFSLLKLMSSDAVVGRRWTSSDGDSNVFASTLRKLLKRTYINNTSVVCKFYRCCYLYESVIAVVLANSLNADDFKYFSLLKLTSSDVVGRRQAAALKSSPRHRKTFNTNLY